MRALVSQNYTYADRAGNILVLWNASLPVLPHRGAATRRCRRPVCARSGRNTCRSTRCRSTLNPGGGYVHNANDSPHFANVRVRRSTSTNAYPNMEPPSCACAASVAAADRHESQGQSGRRRRLKHDYRMLLADRVKPDLVKHVAATGRPGPGRLTRCAVAPVEQHVPRPTAGAACCSRSGGRATRRGGPEAEQFAVPLVRATDPLRTPRGLGGSGPGRGGVRLGRRGGRAAARRVGRRVGRRVSRPPGRRGRAGRRLSRPLGCFRVLGFTRDADGKYAANTGDGWVLAVEFGDEPRAYSVLAYGQSAEARLAMACRSGGDVREAAR
jgi:acyl-homoserine-lactone acylase